MKTEKNKILSLLLYLTGIHSFIVGLGLIFLPLSIFEFLGFHHEVERFFPAQGGVFHLLMAVCYSSAAHNLLKNEQLVIFSVIVKSGATIFLLIYFIFIDPVALVFLSCVSDFTLGLLIYIFYNRLKKIGFFSQDKL